MHSSANVSQVIQISNQASEPTQEILTATSPFQRSDITQLAALWLAIDATDQEETDDGTSGSKRPEHSKTNAHLCRILKHLRFLVKFGSPHLQPFLFVFSAYVNRSIKRNERRRRQNRSCPIHSQSLTV
jgi:hypothetical protein